MRGIVKKNGESGKVKKPLRMQNKAVLLKFIL